MTERYLFSQLAKDRWRSLVGYLRLETYKKSKYLPTSNSFNCLLCEIFTSWQHWNACNVSSELVHKWLLYLPGGMGTDGYPSQWQSKNWWSKGLILLMEEINPAITSWGWQFIYHDLRGFIHPRWFAGFLNHQQQDLSTICPWSSWSSYRKSIRTNSFTASPGSWKQHTVSWRSWHDDIVQRSNARSADPESMVPKLLNPPNRQIDPYHPMWSYSVLSTIQFLGIQDVLFFPALQPKWPERCKKEPRCLREVAGTWLPRNLVCMGILPPRISTAQLKPYSELTGQPRMSRCGL